MYAKTQCNHHMLQAVKVGFSPLSAQSPFKYASMYKGKKGPPSHMPDISEGKEMQQQGLQAIPNSVIDNNVRSPSVSAGLCVGKESKECASAAYYVRVSLPSDCQVVSPMCMCAASSYRRAASGRLDGTRAICGGAAAVDARAGSGRYWHDDVSWPGGVAAAPHGHPWGTHVEMVPHRPVHHHCAASPNHDCDAIPNRSGFNVASRWTSTLRRAQHRLQILWQISSSACR